MKRLRIDLQFDPYWLYLNAISTEVGDKLYPKIEGVTFRRAKVFGYNVDGTINNYFTRQKKNPVTHQYEDKIFQALPLELYDQFQKNVIQCFNLLSETSKEKFKELKIHINARRHDGQYTVPGWREKRYADFNKVSVFNTGYERNQDFWKQLDETQWHYYSHNNYRIITFEKCNSAGICKVLFSIPNNLIRSNISHKYLIGQAFYNDILGILICQFDKSENVDDKPFYFSIIFKIPKGKNLNLIIGHETSTFSGYNGKTVILNKAENIGFDEFALTSITTFLYTFGIKDYHIGAEIYNRDTFLNSIEKALANISEPFENVTQKRWKRIGPFTGSASDEIEFRLVYPNNLLMIYIRPEKQRLCSIGLHDIYTHSITFNFDHQSLLYEEEFPLSITIRPSGKKTAELITGQIVIKDYNGLIESGPMILVDENKPISEKDSQLIQDYLKFVSDRKFPEIFEFPITITDLQKKMK